MADSFQSYKVTSNEQSSATKFNNLVQALEDAINSLDNSNVAAAAAIAVSKLAAGSNGDILTTSAGVPTWAPAASATIPAGAIMPYGGSTAPGGWLLCDGSAVSRTTYATLFGIMGTAYGVGDGATTFNLPDLQGRVPVGKGTHADVAALGDNDGSALADRRPKHKHTVVGTSTGSVQPSAGGANGAVGAGSTVTVGPQTNSPTDAPAYVVVNYVVKT